MKLISQRLPDAISMSLCLGTVFRRAALNTDLMSVKALWLINSSTHVRNGNSNMYFQVELFTDADEIMNIIFI